MTRVVVGIGSNVCPEMRVRWALDQLDAAFAGLRVSPAYRCPAVGFAGNDFVNLVAAVDSDDCLEHICARLRVIETACGRDRTRAGAGVPMDIDLLLFGDLRRAAAPQLPRRDILEQAFVLRPLAELLPEARHPECGRTFDALWREFDADAWGLEQVTLDPGGCPNAC